MGFALEIFGNMKNKDVISWTTIVSGYINRGQVDIARQYFAQMPERDYVLWTAMIDGYLRVNRFREALTLFREMQTSNIRRDEFTTVRILTTYMYCKCGDVEKAQRVFWKMLRKDKFTWTAMIVGLAISGHGDTALDMFSQMLRASIRLDEMQLKVRIGGNEID
ncbi:hypothetical protein KPL71_020953 [Citrus sinensis]|uniref:Uncharacterized protein n=1 Tax=Citrus sinensis TaxID=2711 RepID=A0ACB8JD28_CITSI|nr:hypothetical protein KPL71_020953 [Citrus sinensis]